MLRIAAALLMAVSPGTFAAGEPEFSLVIEKNRFTPDRIEVPAGQKVKLNIDNRDASAEEFESVEMKIEKVIPPKSRATIYIGPLKAGEYPFIGEFHEKTAFGILVAK
jgi:plastocyanin domain-containing protein